MSTLPDDLRLSNDLSRRLFMEADFGQGWACCLRSNGEIRVASNAQSAPHEFQQTFAFDLLRKLNAQIPQGGAWSVGWCNGWGKLIILWMDEDGDTQFTVEDEENVTEILSAGPDHFVGQCFEAWQLWRETQEVLDLQPGETYKKAQGERKPSEQR